MKAFFRSLKRQDGFTLVELMVVVAIIGLLSAVAVPNFKKYQAKAKMSEAKLQLSALYTAETAFFSDYNMYANCLRYMGFDPSGEAGNRYYAVGFPGATTARTPAANTAAINSGMLAVDCPATGAAVDGALGTNAGSYFLAGKGIGGSLVNAVATMTSNPAGAAATCTAGAPTTGGACVGSQLDANNMTFQASAVGYISADRLTAVTASGLTINNAKVLRTVVNGF